MCKLFDSFQQLTDVPKHLTQKPKLVQKCNDKATGLRISENPEERLYFYIYTMKKLLKSPSCMNFQNFSKVGSYKKQLPFLLWKIDTHTNSLIFSENIPLINCEVELILTWFKSCLLIDKLTRDANYGANPIVHKIDNPKKATFKITDTKLYVPVVTLSKENDIKLLEKLKSGFKRTIKWNKYRSQMTIQNNK